MMSTMKQSCLFLGVVLATLGINESNAIAIAVGTSTVLTPPACKMSAQPWLLNGTLAHRGNTLLRHLLVTHDLIPDGSVFNMTSVPTMRGDPWQGSVTGNTIKLKIYAGSFGKDENYMAQECVGTFSSDCISIDWGKQGCLENAAPTPGYPPLGWCGAWTKNCSSQPPPYGFGMSFWDTFDNNMVLQMQPAAAAVYGIATPSATTVSVTITETTTGTSYTVQAKLGVNATHQPIGPSFAGMGTSIPGPFFAWKVLLKPMTAGGNYTLFAKCTGCTGTGDYSNATITNVTFGDVWHCSGQSNMWLPLSSSFSLNATIGNITSPTNSKYHNIRMMAGNSGDGNSIVSNPWMTALQAASLLPVGNHGSPYRKIVDFGATCWYFAQKLTDELEAAGKDVVPIGLTDTAIGGQRIEEYMVNDTSIYSCSDRIGGPSWNGHLYSSMTLPFVDMTVKGWLWYQGENNMGGTKGNSLASVGYACEQKTLVAGWRKAWSETPGTTDPMAPFGIVTLASSGSEGGPNMGPMRQAQTASYGMLPGPMGSGMENTFSAHAYDLDDEWGPGIGPCFDGYQNGRQMTGGWNCCPSKGHPKNTTSCTPEHDKQCTSACLAALDTPSHGGIHPRSKKQVGDRLGVAAFNIVYGGKKSFTGPTLAGCALASDSKTLNIMFNTSLLMGDKVTVMSYPPYVEARGGGGSQLWVQTNASLFCMEPQPVLNKTTGKPIPGLEYCPTWAGGSGESMTMRMTVPMSPTDVDADGAVAANVNVVLAPPPPTPPPTPQLNTQWVLLNYSLGGDGSSLSVDLSPLNGSVPTAVRYAWGIIDCCDYTDPNLYITHGCVANCPIMSTSNLPANPFLAKIVGGKCECIAPQVC